MRVQQAVIKAAIVAALTGAGGGCATIIQDQSSRLTWLADSLAAELATTAPNDPRLAAAEAPLEQIADSLSRPELGLASPVSAAVLERVEPVLTGPEAAELADSPYPMLVAYVAPPLNQVPTAAPAQTGLAMGRFANATLARSMWSEIESVEVAVLTGLAAYTAPAPNGGVWLLVGPVANTENAQQRCEAVAAFGLTCEPQSWPRTATLLPTGSAGAGGAP
jgi:hypothetical protein